jgi:hypothetical protein
MIKILFLARLALAATAVAMTSTAFAQPSTGLQPAGEAPDPIGGSASTHKSAHHASVRHGHRSKIKHRTSVAKRGGMRASSPAAQPMDEPKK